MKTIKEAFLVNLKNLIKSAENKPELESAKEELQGLHDELEEQIEVDKIRKKQGLKPMGMMVLAMLFMSTSCSSVKALSKVKGPLDCAKIAASWGICCETTMHPTDEPRK